MRLDKFQRATALDHRGVIIPITRRVFGGPDVFIALPHDVLGPFLKLRPRGFVVIDILPG